MRNERGNIFIYATDINSQQVFSANDVTAIGHSWAKKKLNFNMNLTPCKKLTQHRSEI